MTSPISVPWCQCQEQTWPAVGELCCSDLLAVDTCLPALKSCSTGSLRLPGMHHHCDCRCSGMWSYQQARPSLYTSPACVGSDAASQVCWLYSGVQLIT